jgi:hypothetical protein
MTAILFKKFYNSATLLTSNDMAHDHFSPGRMPTEAVDQRTICCIVHTPWEK